MSTQAPERHEFQAEVKQVLDIVVHSLYTDKEIFVRELISNASDATEKLRHNQVAQKDADIFDADLDLEIQVTSDEETGEITIRDFGIGMTRDELIENLVLSLTLVQKLFSPHLRKAVSAMIISSANSASVFTPSSWWPIRSRSTPAPGKSKVKATAGRAMDLALTRSSKSRVNVVVPVS